MNLPRRVDWIALLAAAGLTACHHAPVPGGGLFPQQGVWDFRMMGITPQVKGRLTIVDGEFFIDVPSVRCVNFPKIRQHELQFESVGFECRGLPTFPLVDVVINRRDPVHYSSWSGSGSTLEQTTTVRRDCVQTGLDAQGRRICLSYRTETRSTGGSQSGRLEMVPRRPGGGIH